MVFKTFNFSYINMSTCQKKWIGFNFIQRKHAFLFRHKDHAWNNAYVLIVLAEAKKIRTHGILHKFLQCYFTDIENEWGGGVKFGLVWFAWFFSVPHFSRVISFKMSFNATSLLLFISHELIRVYVESQRRVTMGVNQFKYWSGNVISTSERMTRAKESENRSNNVVVWRQHRLRYTFIYVHTLQYIGSWHKAMNKNRMQLS